MWLVPLLPITAIAGAALLSGCGCQSEPAATPSPLTSDFGDRISVTVNF